MFRGAQEFSQFHFDALPMKKTPFYNLEALQPSVRLYSLKSPQINTPSPITQIHRLSFLVCLFFSSHFLVTIPATCFKSSFWQTTNKLKHKHSYNTMWHFLFRTLRKKKKYTYNTEPRKKERKVKDQEKRSICIVVFPMFFLAFLEKRYTVASYQSHITCRYNTT